MPTVLFVILSGMTPAELVKRLLAEQDLKYRDFHASLLPNIDKKKIIGVRVPTMRKIAKEFADSAKGSAKSMPKDVANSAQVFRRKPGAPFCGRTHQGV